MVLIPEPEAAGTLADELLPAAGVVEGLLEAVLPHAASMTPAAAIPATASHRFLI
jgi:hypothetical protein